jgi:hypothetical protein
MKVPGVPTSEMLRLCKPLTENLLVMDVLNVAVLVEVSRSRSSVYSRSSK